MMAMIQVTAATTLNPSPDKKRAAGKNTKWSEKSPEARPFLVDTLRIDGHRR